MEDLVQRTFHIKACLGRGGFGEVYRASMVSQSGLRSDVAVKVLRSDVDLKSDAVRRLRDEGRLLATLNHPCILRVLDFANLDGRTALVTEYVEGEDLTTCITASEPLSPRALLHVIGSVAEALNVAWSSPTDTGEPLKLVHRDIKPSNIRISRHGEVRLLDFGIAWSDDAQREAQTSHNSAVGSLLYMAPERFGRAPVGTPADVYALGCTLFEGLSDAPLFSNSVAIEMVTRAANAADHDAYVQTRVRDLAYADEEVVDLLYKMLAHSPDARPTAAEVAMVCEGLADRMEGTTLKQWCRRHPWIEPGAVESGWVEQVFVDGITSSQSIPRMNTSDTGTTSDTFHFGLEPGADSTMRLPLDEPASGEQPALAVPEPSAPSSSSRGLWVGGLGLIAGALLVWGMSGGREQVVPPQTDQVPTAAPPVVVEPVAPPAQVIVPEPESGTEAPEEGTEAQTDAPAVVAPPVRPTRVSPKRVAVDVGSDTLAPPTAASVEPVAPPEPVAKPKAPGRVESASPGIAVRLRRGGEVFPIGALPPGVYEYDADFGGGWAVMRSVEIVSGGVVTIRCNAMTYSCEES